MPMTNVVEERGFFWWWQVSGDNQGTPPAAAANGLLTISDEGHIKLKLDRELPKDGPFPLPMRQAKPFPDGQMITGKLNDSGKIVLLDSIQLTSFSWSDSPLRPEGYTADTCLIGDFPFDISNVLDFSHFRIDLAGLNDWLNLGTIRSTMIDTDGENVEFSVKYERPSFSFKLDEFDLSIETVTTTPNMLFDLGATCSVAFKQEFWLEFGNHAKTNLTSLKADFICVEEFFAILMGSYLRLDWPYAVQGIGEDERWYRLYFFRGSVPEFEPGLGNTLTWFSWLRDSLGELFSNWKSKREQYGPGYYLYLAGLRNSDLYAEHRFVNLIWALESLHRKKNSEKHVFDERIQKILSKFQEPHEKEDLKWLKSKLRFACGPNLEDRIFETFVGLPINLDRTALRKFAIKCQERRNQISHTGGPPDRESYSDFHQDLIYLTDALSHLYQAMLLQEIGLPEDKLKLAFTTGHLAGARILPSFRIFGLVDEVTPKS